MDSEIFNLSEKLNKLLKKQLSDSIPENNYSLSEEEKAAKRVEKESLKDLYKTIQTHLL